MPRSGSGPYSYPAGTTAVSNTPISSVAYNARGDDLLADLNAPRPVTAGGTGATSPAAAFEALSPMTARGDLVTRDATTSKRLPIGAAGTMLGSNGTDVVWQGAATETAAGPVEIATEAENAARTVANKAVVPKYNPYPPGHLTGCRLTNGADAQNDITISPGKARDDEDDVNIILAPGITKRLNMAWSVGNNQGGLDTGVVTNTTYHVWLIKRSDTGVVDALFSAAGTAPTMPANYDSQRRVGAILREAGSNVAFRQSGDRFWRSTPTSDLNDANPGIVAVTRTLKVPLGIQVNALVLHVVVERASSELYYGLLSSLLDTNVVPSAASHDVQVITDSGADAAVAAVVPREITTDTSAQIRSRLSHSSADTTERILTLGWIDPRGRI